MSLRKNDLKYMVSDIFEVDSYSSKMGEDADIVTLAFSVKDKQPADDLVKFLENGYKFILDADVSPGELDDSTYKVFVEIDRNSDIDNNIFEILDGIKKLSGIDNFKYRYYKNFKSKPATIENLQVDIPKSVVDYDTNKNQIAMENYKNFFKDSYIESIEFDDDVMTLKKSYCDGLQLKIIDIGDTDKILENLKEKYNPWEFAEIIYMSKYIGDYNITKYGNKLTLEQNGKTLVVERL